MGWLLLVVAVICMVHQLFSKKNRQSKRKNQNMYNKPANKKKRDDFAGGSVGSLFLMEEFIDSGVGGRESLRQDPARIEQEEEDCFADEFLE